MELGFTNELRNKVAASFQNIKPIILEKSITIEYKADEPFKHNEYYYRTQANKISAFKYFLDLVEVFNEIRYSTISAECCRELMKGNEPSIEEKKELGWRFKYYVESTIYRYYSFWEYVGRFFNEYYDLKLDIDQKDYSKERVFYFAREVLNTVIKDYYHKIIADILELWAKSKDVFDYRIIKTHKQNPRIGEKIFQITKEQTARGRTLKFDTGKQYTGNDLLKLLMISYRYSRLSLEYISDFFDIGHSEVKKNSPEKTKSIIIIPDSNTILKFQKILKMKK